MSPEAGACPLLDSAAVRATAASIASSQGSDGMIGRTPGGPGDPWNHVEGAIALDLAGLHDESSRAYRWLATHQRADGSWFATYRPDGSVAEHHVDTNAVAYVATGVLAHLLCGAGADLAALGGVVGRALEFVLGRERGRGVLPWSVQEDGSDAPISLLAASSSVSASLRHGAQLAERLGAPSLHLGEAAERIAASISGGRPVFADKSSFAMDWYYPVLTQAITGPAARRRLEEGRAVFVTSDGVRCRAEERWVTTAESAEAAIAYAGIGELDEAHRLLASVADKRLASGAYLTGLVYPERSEFPPGETSHYSAAAVLIANDVLSGGRLAPLFRP